MSELFVALETLLTAGVIVLGATAAVRAPGRRGR